MKASDLWEQLGVEYPDRVARVADAVKPIAGSAQDLLDRIFDLKRQASVANDKCGTFGNPYEQPAEDFSVLLCEAQRISGTQARFPWERSSKADK